MQESRIPTVMGKTFWIEHVKVEVIESCSRDKKSGKCDFSVNICHSDLSLWIHSVDLEIDFFCYDSFPVVSIGFLYFKVKEPYTEGEHCNIMFCQLYYSQWAAVIDRHTNSCKTSLKLTLAMKSNGIQYPILCSNPDMVIKTLGNLE